MIQPITPKRNYEVVCEQIIQLIKNGEYQPGGRIPAEAELLTAFGVGRGSIREAIKSLQSQGIVASFPGKGTFVTEDALARINSLELVGSITREDSIKHLLEIRLILEPKIAYFAALRGNKTDCEELFAIIDQMRQGQTRTDILTYGQQFHSKLAAMCGNPILVNLYDTVSEPLYRLRLMEFVTLDIYRQGTNEHFAIAEAVRSHDAALAQKLMHDHLVADYPSYLAALENQSQ